MPISKDLLVPGAMVLFWWYKDKRSSVMAGEIKAVNPGDTYLIEDDDWGYDIPYSDIIRVRSG